MSVTVLPIVTGALGIVLKSFEERLEELEIRERIKTMYTIEISLNTLKSSWNLKRIIVSENLEKEKLARSNCMLFTLVFNGVFFNYFHWSVESINLFRSPGLF